MKYLVISDIHGDPYFLEMVLSKVNDFDKLIILGDVLYHGPRNDLPNQYNPKRVISVLNEISDKIIGVRGNCDAKIDLELLDFNINEHRILKNSDFNLFLTHGDVYNCDNLPELEGKYTVIHGHTHVNKACNFGCIQVINIGSISLPKDGIHAYALIEGKSITVYDLFNNDAVANYTL